MMIQARVAAPTGPGGFNGLGLGFSIAPAPTGQLTNADCTGGQTVQYDPQFDEYYCGTAPAAKPVTSCGMAPLIKGVNNCTLFASLGLVALAMFARR